MDIQLVRGPRATTLLEDEPFGRSWAELFSACPWASTFQDPRFVRIWHRHYRETFELIGLWSGPSDAIEGILFLARPRAGGDLVAAGSHHAEYQAWLAKDEESGERFIQEALRALQKTFPDGRLRLGFLAPGVPTQWLQQAPWDRLVDVRIEPGAWIDTDSPELNGRLARRKLRKLESIEKSVRLEVITDAETFERELPSFQDLCDFRQASINDVRPFREDPCKGPFHADLVRHAPDLMHVSRLICEAHVLSAQINMRHRRDVLVCVQGHLPQMSRHSPGFCHMVLLAKRLSDEGVPALDLSPGGGYKQRNATRTAPTHDLRIDLSPAAAWRRRIRTQTMRQLRTITRQPLKNGITLEDYLRKARSWASNQPRNPSGLLRSLGHTLRQRVDLDIWALDPGGDPISAPTQIRIDDIGDILSYHPRSSTDVSRWVFCRAAADRWAYEHHIYTTPSMSKAHQWVWLARGPTEVSLDPDLAKLKIPEGEALFYDAGGSLQTTQVGNWMAHASRASKKIRLLWAIAKHDENASTIARSLGFRLIFSLHSESRFGDVRHSSVPPAEYTATQTQTP